MCNRYLSLFSTLYPSSLLSWMLDVGALSSGHRAVLGVFCACVLYFGNGTCSAQLSMFHMERHSRNKNIIITGFPCRDVCFRSSETSPRSLLSNLCGTKRPMTSTDPTPLSSAPSMCATYSDGCSTSPCLRSTLWTGTSWSPSPGKRSAR